MQVIPNGNFYFNVIQKNKDWSFDKSVSEFNYKLLHYLLTANLLVSKDDKNKNMNGKFNICNMPENLIDIDVTWKMIVNCFIFINNKCTFILDKTLSLIACKILQM